MTRHDDAAAEQGQVLAHLVGAVANLNDTMRQMSTGMKTRDGARLVGAEARSIGLIATNNPGGTGVVAGPSSGLLLGVNVREVNGSRTNVRVFDGVDASGLLLWGTMLPAFGAETQWLSLGVAYTGGLFVQVTPGAGGAAVEGALYTSAGKIA